MKKKLLVKAAALCAVLTFGFTASGFAQAERTAKTQAANDWLVCSCGKTMQEHQNAITAADKSTLDYLNCSCGGRLMEQAIYTSPAEYTGEATDCKHSTGGMDYETICTVTYNITCNRCTLSAQRQEEKAVWECSGFLKPSAQDEVSTSGREVSTEVHQQEVALPEENEEAKSAPCSYCGGKSVESLLFASEWGFTGEKQPCTHGTIGGDDKEQSRVVLYRAVCDSCELASQKVETETAWACYGVV